MNGFKLLVIALVVGFSSSAWAETHSQNQSPDFLKLVQGTRAQLQPGQNSMRHPQYSLTSNLKIRRTSGSRSPASDAPRSAIPWAAEGAPATHFSLLK